MSCKCSEYRLNKCRCKVLRTGYTRNNSDSIMLLTHSNSLCRILDLKGKPKSNVIVRLIENIYELCAGYNLRYCPIRGFSKRDCHFGDTLKDVLILLCFLIANFVVLLTILTKMVVHVFFVLIMAAHWMKRYFSSKQKVNEEYEMMIRPTQLSHIFTPSTRHDIFDTNYT